VRRQERELDHGKGTRKKDINFVRFQVLTAASMMLIIFWELPVARVGIRNLEGEAEPIAITFRAKPPPYAISWRVFQRIAEHRPRVRNFGK
jgi:hypothetical protein